MERIHPLREYRDRQVPPLTQGQLAQILGVTTGTISRWEAGTRKIDEEKLSSVAELTRIPPAALRPDLAKLFQSEAAE